MNFSEIAKNRQSCRFFDNTKQVEDEKIKAILESTVLSPSACNAQPYHFTVCKGEKAKEVAEATRGMGMNKFTENFQKKAIIKLRESGQKLKIMTTVQLILVLQLLI